MNRRVMWIALPMVIMLAGGAPLAQGTAKPAAPAAPAGDAKLAAYKKDAVRGVDEMAKLAQEMVDSVFSFGELGLPGSRDLEVPHRRMLEKYGFKVQRGVAGIPTAWVATWGSRQAGDRAGLRHRRHSAGVAEARRGLPRSDHRGRARTRRRPQHRRAAQHRRRAGGEEDHGARQAARHADAVAGRGRGAAGVEGVVRPRRHVQGRGRGAVHARRQQPRRVVGRWRRQRHGVGRVHLPGRDRAQRRARRGAAARRWTRWS